MTGTPAAAQRWASRSRSSSRSRQTSRASAGVVDARERRSGPRRWRPSPPARRAGCRRRRPSGRCGRAARRARAARRRPAPRGARRRRPAGRCGAAARAAPAPLRRSPGWARPVPARGAPARAGGARRRRAPRRGRRHRARSGRPGPRCRGSARRPRRPPRRRRRGSSVDRGRRSRSPRSRRASTTTRTSASWSAYVVVTWRVPVRSDTGQWMRRSRSPVRKARISASSVPPPTRAPRCWPDEPDRVRQTGPRGEAARGRHRGEGLGALLRPGPGERREVAERTDLRRAEAPHPPAVAAGLDGHGHRGAAATAPATWPWVGVVVVQRSPGQVRDGIPQAGDAADVDPPPDRLALVGAGRRSAGWAPPGSRSVG